MLTQEQIRAATAHLITVANSGTLTEADLLRTYYIIGMLGDLASGEY